MAGKAWTVDVPVPLLGVVLDSRERIHELCVRPSRRNLLANENLDSSSFAIPVSPSAGEAGRFFDAGPLPLAGTSNGASGARAASGTRRRRCLPCTTLPPTSSDRKGSLRIRQAGERHGKLDTPRDILETYRDRNRAR